MNERDFAYWLQGFVEIANRRPTEEEWKQIVDHLSLVFNKVTPDKRPVSDDLQKAVDFFRPGMTCGMGGTHLC